MSTTTIYKCDKCGEVQPNNGQFWTVGIKAQCQGGGYSGDYKTAWYIGDQYKMEVCRACLESFGIYAKKREAQPAQPAPSLEDLIREIVRQEMPQP